jgi:SanA protein
MKFHTIGTAASIFIILIILVLLIVIVTDRYISRVVRERIYSDHRQLPELKTALVLGTSRYRPDGRVNLYFHFRLEAAKELLDAGKVRYLLVSGDNALENYNEPLEMKRALLEMGVPGERIILDYAGFRTLDSVVRCRQVFGQERFIVVSQQFHNERALFIARYYGIDAVAYNAKDVYGAPGAKVRFREYLARVKAVMDLFMLGTAPRFLGESEVIPE